ncbi:MAG: hypothetical protein JW993_06285 [Sedimentisphaerales bacterium]|nr:hypothetical protein [Sedimentisphaerales bacterium]
MEERRAGIMGVVVVALVVLGVGLQSAAWGQVMEAEEVEVVQVPRRAPRRVAPPPVEWEEPAPERIDELNRRREELAERARDRQNELRELEEARIARQREVRAELSEIHRQLADMEARFVELERQREAARRRLLARAQDQSARLTERLRALQEQAEQMERTLAELRERDGERGRALEISLAETREQMHRLEMELRGLDVGRPAPVLRLREQMPRPMRESQPLGEEPMRRRRVVPERQGTMMLQPARPVMEMREQLGDIQAQVQRNSEKVEQLGVEVSRLNDGLAQTQDRVNALAAPRCPGTIGSAAYDYGWQPNFRLYYQY